jgi:hypothetical protein
MFAGIPKILIFQIAVGLDKPTCHATYNLDFRLCLSIQE